MKAILASVAVLMLAGPASAANFEASMLAGHNSERAAVGVPPLTWSEPLAADAQSWADHLAKTGRFEHSDAGTRKDEGENLWEGTHGGFTYEEMVASWANEKRYYKGGVFQSGGGAGGQPIGHYTQMVWRNTTKVGCAIASGAEYDVLVCRYDPPGNFIGEMPY